MRINGPISRINRPIINCEKCGNIKKNIIYRNEEPEIIDEKNDDVEPEKIEIPITKAKQPKRTHYIKSIIEHQKSLSAKYMND